MNMNHIETMAEYFADLNGVDEEYLSSAHFEFEDGPDNYAWVCDPHGNRAGVLHRKDGWEISPEELADPEERDRHLKTLVEDFPHFRSAEHWAAFLDNYILNFAERKQAIDEYNKKHGLV